MCQTPQPGTRQMVYGSNPAHPPWNWRQNWSIPGHVWSISESLTVLRLSLRHRQHWPSAVPKFPSQGLPVASEWRHNLCSKPNTNTLPSQKHSTLERNIHIPHDLDTVHTRLWSNASNSTVLTDSVCSSGAPFSDMVVVELFEASEFA